MSERHLRSFATEVLSLAKDNPSAPNSASSLMPSGTAADTTAHTVLKTYSFSPMFDRLQEFSMRQTPFRLSSFACSAALTGRSSASPVSLSAILLDCEPDSL